MLKFFRNTTIAFLALVLLTLVTVYTSLIKSKLDVSLFPGRDADFIWKNSTEPQTPISKTSLSLKNETGVVEYEFVLDPQQPSPYTHYAMYFTGPNGYKMLDLTRFNSISFKVICDPKNTLLMVLFSFDEKVTDLRNMPSRRFSRTAFSCDSNWSTVTIPFDDLDTPHWWLNQYSVDLSDTGYQLNKTLGFAWANSSQSPLNQLSHVRLTDVKLLGKDYRYLYAAGAFSLLLWLVFLMVIFRQYLKVLTLHLQDKLIQDQQLIAYKK